MTTIKHKRSEKLHCIDREECASNKAAATITTSTSTTGAGSGPSGGQCYIQETLWRTKIDRFDALK